MPEKMRTERGSLSRSAPETNPCALGRAERLRPGPSRVLAASDLHRDPLHRVVRVALQVPGGLQWLGVARRVGGARAQHVLAGPGVPFEAPSAPGGVPERLVEQGTPGGTMSGRGGLRVPGSRGTPAAS